MTFIDRLFPSRKLTMLRSARMIADKALQRAVLSMDTQAINKAQDAMRKATHAVMAAELGVKRG